MSVSDTVRELNTLAGAVPDTLAEERQGVIV